ncbi:MAG: phasin family protein [Pseudomonadota bacterium]
MGDEKDKVSDKASEIAKNIWLAGVGAYGKAVDEAQGRLERAMEPPKLFRDLVKAGSALEEDARNALEAGNAAKSSVEQRINRVRENFHMQRPARIEDIAALQKKVDVLSRKVDKLARALADQTRPNKKAPVKKAASKKAAAKKATARKAPVKKAARKKTPKKKKS